MRLALQRKVWERAGRRCEYCQVPSDHSDIPHVIDHVRAKQHGGKATYLNLALCCGSCNRHKGPNVAGIDPKTSRLTRLFNPRTDRWEEHFFWQGPRVQPLTAVGRVTVYVLAMNDEHQVLFRQVLMGDGLF
jgi:hypothetical protein